MSQDVKPEVAVSTPEASPLQVGARYVLRLFVAGQSPRSMRALAVLRRLLAHFPGAQLQVIDVYQQPDMARSERVFAFPTLVKEVPSPSRRLTGDLSNEERILTELDLEDR